MANYIKIRIRRDSTKNWAMADPVLMLGEIAADMDKHGLKVGDGTSKWSELPFYGIEVINDLVTGGTNSALSAEQGKELKTLIDNLTKAFNSGGATGADGKAATIKIGTVTTGAAGSTATVSNSGTTTDAVFNFTIPKGDKGDKGNSFTYSDFTSEQLEGLKGPKGDTGATGAKGADGATPTIKIGTVTTGAAGSSAAVTASTSGTTTTLNFTIPKGDKGDTGSGGGGSVEVVNKLDSTDPDKALSANMGRVLNDKIKGFGIFGMGYTISNFDKNGKPLNIAFEDGVTCDLEWAGAYLQKITASTGEVMTLNYNDYGTIIGRTITRGGS